MGVACGVGVRTCTCRAQLAAAVLRKLAVTVVGERSKADAVLGWAQGREEIVPLLAHTGPGCPPCAGGPGYLNLAAALESAEVGAEAQRGGGRMAPGAAHDPGAAADGLLTGDGYLFIGQGVAPEACDIVLAPADRRRVSRYGASWMRWSSGRWSRALRAFWQNQFANCVHCDGCRSACPFRCYDQRGTIVVPGIASGQAPNSLADCLRPGRGRARSGRALRASVVVQPVVPWRGCRSTCCTRRPRALSDEVT